MTIGLLVLAVAIPAALVIANTVRYRRIVRRPGNIMDHIGPARSHDPRLPR